MECKTYSFINIVISKENTISINDLINTIKNYDITIIQNFHKKYIKDIVKDFNYIYNYGTILISKFNFEQFTEPFYKNNILTLLFISPSETLFFTIFNNQTEEQINQISKMINHYSIKYPSIIVGEINESNHHIDTSSFKSIHDIYTNKLFISYNDFKTIGYYNFIFI